MCKLINLLNVIRIEINWIFKNFARIIRLLTFSIYFDSIRNDCNHHAHNLNYIFIYLLYLHIHIYMQ